jgi:hypothetical protein
MQINSSVQLPLERALKALIPYLQSLDDPDELWDFLDDAFPDSFLFMAGHEAPTLSDEKTSYCAFIAGLPDNRAIGDRYPQVSLRIELGTAGIADETTRTAAIEAHSVRIAAIIRLFSLRYYNALRAVFNADNIIMDDRPWKGLGFDAWNADKPQEGFSPSGKAFVAQPSFLFIVHYESEPDAES